jgi:ABC-type transporter Mla subunit MlaD
VSAANKDEMIGRIYRAKTANRQRLAFVNSELNGIAGLLKKASSQLECLLANERSELHSVLSQLDINRTLQLLAEREKLNRDIHSANDELRRLGVPL